MGDAGRRKAVVAAFAPPSILQLGNPDRLIKLFCAPPPEMEPGQNAAHAKRHVNHGIKTPMCCWSWDHRKQFSSGGSLPGIQKPENEGIYFRDLNPI
jgi:hypothetical protein